MNQRNSEEIELDIGKILKRLRHNALLIVVSAAVGTAAAFLLALLITPKYQSTAMFYVKNSSQTGSGSISSADIAASKNLVDSYIVILQSEETLQTVSLYAGTDKRCEDLREMISASAVNSTEFFRVIVTGTDPVETEYIANAIGSVLPERIARIMEGASAKIVDTAVTDSEPCSPDYAKLIAFGFLAGLLLSVGGSIVAAVLDDTICRERDITKNCTYPVLTCVSQTDTFAAESYKRLRARLVCSLPAEGRGQVIGITSPRKGEGKSAAAGNLAGALTHRGKRTLLIDCCIRQPLPEEDQSRKKEPGLTDFLAGRCSLKHIVRLCSKEHNTIRFHVIAAGEEENAELLTSPRMKLLLKAARKIWDYVLLDLPSAEENSDVLELAQQTDGIVLLVRREHCRAQALRETIGQLEFVKAKILGVVFNSTAETKDENK